MTYKQALTRAQQLLKRAKIENPELEALVLLCASIQKSKEYVYTWPEKKLSLEQENLFSQFIAKRCQGVPTAYLTQEKEFYGLKFKVNPHTLIPRPETEIIIEHVQKLFAPKDKFIFCDLGTGSGCLGITLAKIFPKSKGILVDLSQKALSLAQENAVFHRVNKRLLLVQANLVKVAFSRPLQLMVANPPYIAQKDMANLSPEVKQEPARALDGGKTGLKYYPHLARLARQFLAPDGFLLVEFGFNQTKAIQTIFKTFNLKIIPDLAGKDRVGVITKST